MHYQIDRNGQMYGPYTMEDVQRYLASGHILSTDLAKSEEMTEWIPVSQLLANAGAAQTSAPVGYGAATPPAYGPAGGTAVVYPDPPNIHWVLVLVLGIFTCGIFTVIYDMVQAAWMKRVQPNSKALGYYIAATVFWILNLGVSLRQMVTLHIGYTASHTNYTGGLFSLLYAVMLIVARFAMRNSLEEHYNGPEPIGLRLSGVMTFFFGSLYFQYHFNRINEMKRGLRYR